MDQPGRRRGSGGAEIALLNQDHPQATAGGVACDADAVEPAANNRKIVVRHTPVWMQRVRSSLHLEHDPKKVRTGFSKRSWKKTKRRKRDRIPSESDS
jgi:hypothetical protein